MALGIASGLLSISSGKKKDYRILQDDLSSGEKLVLTSWAKQETHNTLGRISNILTYVLIIQGLVLRFMIALEKRYSHLQITSYGVDLTLSRRFHTFGGISVWILTRLTLLFGAGLHSVYFGSTMYFLILGEIIFFFILYVIFEILYRLKRKNWKYPLAVSPTRQGDYSKMLEQIRSKGKHFQPIFKKLESTYNLKKAFPNKLIFIYGNRVYDLDNYIHPGGQWIFFEARCKRLCLLY